MLPHHSVFLSHGRFNIAFSGAHIPLSKCQLDEQKTIEVINDAYLFPPSYLGRSSFSTWSFDDKRPALHSRVNVTFLDINVWSGAHSASGYMHIYTSWCNMSPSMKHSCFASIHFWPAYIFVVNGARMLSFSNALSDVSHETYIFRCTSNVIIIFEGQCHRN